MKFEALKDKKRAIILSTDIAGDCDDVGAIALLHSYLDEYDIPLLGIVNCTTKRSGTDTVYAINKFFGRPDIPLAEYDGTDLSEQAQRSRYTAEIAERFGKGAPVPETSLKFYRRTLANAEDDGVILITIGFFTDLAELLKSGADEFSPLSGVELVRKKVHAVVSMAFKYPGGREFNIHHAPAAAECVIDLLPVDMYVSDFNLGRGLITGFDPDDAERLRNNPIFESYRLFTADFIKNRCKNNSYDLTAVEFAFDGTGRHYCIADRGNIRFYCGENPEDPEARDATEFVPDENGNVYIIAKTVENRIIEEYLNKRIAQ